MSIVVAFQLDDYLVLAADHRAIIGWKDSQEELVIDGISKFRQVPCGVMAMTGDHLLGECFYQEAMTMQESCSVESMAARALIRYRMQYSEALCMTTTVFLTTQSMEEDKDQLHIVKFTDIKITTEPVEAMTVFTTLSAIHPIADFWEIVVAHLRRADEFPTMEGFYNHHLNLIQHIWREQVKFDNQISPTFDFYVHNCKTKKGLHVLYDDEDVLKIPPAFFYALA